MTRYTIAAALVLMLAPLSATAQPNVNVVQYAVSNPVGDASLRNPPSLGASVPNAVSLQPINGAPNFGYFYYDGQPVIVDLRTQSIVKIGT